jgi:23S rRNA (cytosine1962-C5)-methyltransferase
MQFIKITLAKGKERSLIHRHPWVFSGAIAKKEQEPEEGAIVEVFSNTGEYLATGHYHSGSIAVRCFDFEHTKADRDFWIKKITAACALRFTNGVLDQATTNCFRLVHGEGDGLPGLIIDFYKGTAVLQAHTSGIYKVRDQIVAGLQAFFGDKLLAIYDKSSESLGKQQQGETQNGFLYKKNEDHPEGCVVEENGKRFYVSWAEGQKTGFFLDQRENRALLERYAAGRKVLNTFSYSGGFSIYALAGGAQLVHSVDSSAKAEAWALRNVKENDTTVPHSFFCQDTFDFFKSSHEQYDLIVLDPPAFAKRLSALKQACGGYQRLNEVAFRKIAPGGILFTFSCSQVIDRKLFRQLVFAAASTAGRKVRILHQLTQGPDHPINLYHPEGEYLKGLVLQVD